MKLVRFTDGVHEGYGQIQEEEVRVLKNHPLTGALQDPWEKEVYALSEIKLLPPVKTPRQIVAIGLNYQAHIEEFQRDGAPEPPQFPIAFMIAQSALCGPGDSVHLTDLDQRIDYEAELVAVIGQEISHIGPEEVPAAILGYTCGNDISARNLQKQDKQWMRAKSFPGFKPCGPWIETELDPTSLELSTRVNGELRQSGNTKHMIFPVFELISKLTSFMTLYPGDLIYTGTPAGVGPLQPGDVCEIEVEGIGVLRNFIDKAI